MAEREELLHLRSMVQTLTQRLVVLDPLQSKLESVSTLHDELVRAVWEDLTRRQRAQREQSELENAKLRGILDEQLELAKDLGRLIAQRQRNLHVTSPPESSPWLGASSPVIHPSVFDEMMQSLPNMNNQVDGILRDPRFLSQPVAEPQQDLRLRCNERGIYFEITESCEVQFAFEDVVELFWRVVCMDQRETQGEMLEVNTYRTENALMRVFQGQPGAPNTGGRVYGKAAHQRFVEPRRVTIVGSVIAQPERVLGVTMSGLVIRHQIWHVFEPSPNKNATFFRTYHLATPDIYDN